MRCLPTACFVACLTATAASAQVSTALLRETDPLAGAPAGQLVSSINEVDVNQAGGFAATVNSTDGTNALSHVWGNATGGAGAILRTEQLGIAGYDQTAFETFFGFADLGQIAYSPTCNATGGGPTGLDCAWVDGTPIAVEGQPITTLPGMVWRFNSRPGILANGTIYWVGGINTSGGVNMGEGLFLGASQTSILKTGDPAPAPLTSLIGDVDFDVRYSALGTHWIMNVDTTEPAASDEVLLIDGAIATLAGGGQAREGQVVPVAAGGNGTEAWGPAFGALSINEAGDHCWEGDTTAATTADAVIVKNGVIRWRESDVVDGLTLLGAPQELYMNEDGDVAFVWNTVGNIEALFLNGQELVKEGDTVDWDGNGTTDAGFVIADITGSVSQLIGPRAPNGQIDVYFTADIDVDGAGTAPLVEGLFRLSVPPEHTAFCFGDGTATACPCGNASPVGADEGCLSSLGMGGRLRATGTASIAADTLVLQGSQMPDSSALYFQGTIQVNGGLGFVFGDGLRCAGGTINRLKPATNVGGSSQFPDTGDPSVSVKGNVTSPGTRTYQVWYRNAASFCTPSTFNLTNGIEVLWGT